MRVAVKERKAKTKVDKNAVRQPNYAFHRIHAILQGISGPRIYQALFGTILKNPSNITRVS